MITPGIEAEQAFHGKKLQQGNILVAPFQGGWYVVRARHPPTITSKG